NRVEAATGRLAAQARGNDDGLAAGDLAHFARADALVGREAGAVEQVGRLPPGEVLVGVDQADAADHAAALQGVRGHAADQPAAADDADFHAVSYWVTRSSLRPSAPPPVENRASLPTAGSRPAPSQW